MFGAELPLAARFVIAFLIVIALIAITAWLINRFGGPRLGAAAARGRQPRLAVLDAASVDSRRKLVLVRRDNIEHLLLIGGPTDVVVEPNIVRAVPMPAPMHDGRRPPHMEPNFDAVPHDMRAGVPASRMPETEDDGDQFAPHPSVAHPAMPPVAQPPQPVPPREGPMNERFGAALRRPFTPRPADPPKADVPAEPPARPQPPRVEPVVAPVPPVTMPPEVVEPPVAAKQEDIASAIEDVLALHSKAAAPAPAQPAPPTPQPEPPVTMTAPKPDIAKPDLARPDLSMPRRAPVFGQRPSGGPIGEPRVEPRLGPTPPAPTAPVAQKPVDKPAEPPKEAAAKTVFDSLEQEMASLLGRTPGKDS